MVTEQKPDKKKRKRSRPYRKSGVYRVDAALKKGGLTALDRRSATYRAVQEWKAQLTEELGGDLSVAKETVLDVAATTLVRLLVIKAKLDENPEWIVNGRNCHCECYSSGGQVSTTIVLALRPSHGDGR